MSILRFLEQSIGSVDRYRSEFTRLFEMPFNSTNKFSMCISRERKTGRTFALMKGASESILKKCDRVLIEGVEQPITGRFKQRFDQVYNTLGGYAERIIGQFRGSFGWSALESSLRLHSLPSGIAGLCDQQLIEFDSSKPLDWNSAQIPKSGFRFLGFVTMIDPPRPTVPNAVLDCRQAGIKVRCGFR